MTANRLLLAAIAVLARAARAQETDSDVASMGEQVFRRFASLCRDQKAACDAAFKFVALVGADAAMRCALDDDRIACFKKTMNSQEFMEEEREGNNRADGSQTVRVNARQWQPMSGSSYARRREGRLSGRPFLVGGALEMISIMPASDDAQ
jgi:hypothetical protein